MVYNNKCKQETYRKQKSAVKPQELKGVIKMKTKVQSITEKLDKLNANLMKANEAVKKAEIKLEKTGRLEEVKTVIENRTFSDWWETAEQKIANIAFDYSCKIERVNELRKDIEKAYSKLTTAIGEEEAQASKNREIEKEIEYCKSRQMRTFADEQREWLKDNIVLESRYCGTTPKGKAFAIYENNGITERSNHCYTLRIAGATVFTSGEFWKAYKIIKNN